MAARLDLKTLFGRLHYVMPGETAYVVLDDRKAKRQEWVEAVQRLMTQLDHWLRQADEDQVLEVNREVHQIAEDCGDIRRLRIYALLGRLTVPAERARNFVQPVDLSHAMN